MRGKLGSEAKSVKPAVTKPLGPLEQVTVFKEDVPTSNLGSNETDTVWATAGAGAAVARLRVARKAEAKVMVDFMMEMEMGEVDGGLVYLF